MEIIQIVNMGKIKSISLILAFIICFSLLIHFVSAPFKNYYDDSVNPSEEQDDVKKEDEGEKTTSGGIEDSPEGNTEENTEGKTENTDKTEETEEKEDALDQKQEESKEEIKQEEESPVADVDAGPYGPYDMPMEYGAYAWLMNPTVGNLHAYTQIKIGPYYLYNQDHLCYGYTPLAWAKSAFDTHAENINGIIAKHPELNFYAYYIEKESDIDFENGVHGNNAAYFLSKLNIQEGQAQRFYISDFDAFDSYFYKNDHHWNYLGSYRGYRQLVYMLTNGDTPLQPSAQYTVGTVVGSKTDTDQTSSYTDDFSCFCFNLPDYDIVFNKEAQSDYGYQDIIVEKYIMTEDQSRRIYYGEFYGQDNGQTIIDNLENNSGRKILVIGDSYDNAVLKLLASHFDVLYSVDLRNYKTEMGEEFNFDSYAASNGITDVLFIGNIDFYIGEAFLIN